MKKKIIFIINPISGTVSKAKIPSYVKAGIDTKKFDYQFVNTEYAGHASLIAKQATEEKVDIVVAVGGDGTINEVGRSLINTKTAMAIIPCGSGNGLARHLCLPMNVKKCIDIINQCDIKSLDYGVINNHPFFCTCGMGFDAFISMQFAKAGKRGALTYVQKVLEVGLSYKPEVYEIETNGATLKHKAFLISAANASQYGNNAYIAPQATMSDGLLDITLIEPFGVVDAAKVAIEMFNKTLDKNDKVKTFKCSHVHIHRQKPGVIHFDGDPIESSQDVDISIVPKGIRVVMNPTFNIEDMKPNVAQTALSEFFSSFGHLRQGVNNKGKRMQSLYYSLLDKLKI